MSVEPFFSIEGTDRFVPRPHACSPWSPDMLHGRLLAALAARATEQHHLDDGLRPARLTIDLFRSPAMEPVEVRHRRLRDGGRVRVVEVDLTAGGHDVARASIVVLRTGPHPEGETWTRPDWDVPDPDDIPDPMPSEIQSVTAMQIRAVGGRGFGAAGQRQVWLRDQRDLVDGEPLSPFQRVAMAADFVSPLGNSSDMGLAFINADISLHLGRLPIGEWIGIEVGSHVAHDGVAVTRSDLFDRDGAIGFAGASAVTNARMARPTSAPPPSS